VSLSFEVRRVGDASVIRCSGRMAEGSESAALLRMVGDILPHTRLIVLNLEGIQSIDSGGLGLLVRVATRIQSGGGRVKTCALSPKVADVLHITHLEQVFDIYTLEEDAIAAFHAPVKSADGSMEFVYANILCAVRSADVLTYTSEVLRQAGYDVLTADNLADAVTLIKVMKPKLVVTTPELRAVRETAEGQAFGRLTASTWVVELPTNLSKEDAGESAKSLLERVSQVIGAPGAAARPVGRSRV
jgi:anti-sigma B factor antagonist